MGVTHMPDNLAKSELVGRSCVAPFEIRREGVIRNHVSPRPASGLAFTGKTCPQDGVRSRTCSEVFVLPGALFAPDQWGA